MKKQAKNNDKYPPFDNTTPSWSSLFINASEQRFFSPLLLNFLCLKQAPGKTMDRLGETYSERERVYSENHIPTVTQYETPVVDMYKKCTLPGDEEDDDVDNDSNAHTIDTTACNKKEKPITNNAFDNVTIDAIFAFLNIATDGRITKECAYENDGKTIRKQFAREIILLLGTLRVKVGDNNAFVDNLLLLSKTLEKCVNDMSCLFHVTECPQRDHRECQITVPVSSFLDNGATLDMMTRRCITMVATLQRKALNIATRRQRIQYEIEKRLGQKPSEIANEDRNKGNNENETNGTNSIFEARDVANALKDAYQLEEELSEQLSQTRAQLEHVSEMINTTRQSLVKMSSLLFGSYRATYLHTRKTQSILLRVPNIPAVLNDTFAIETFCTDLLQTIEAIRQFSTNADKLIESRYDNAIKHAIWPTCTAVSNNATVCPVSPTPRIFDDTNCREFSRKYNAINRLHEDTLEATMHTNNQTYVNSHETANTDDSQNDNENRRDRYVKHLSEAYTSFIQIVQQARRNVNDNIYHRAPHDIRAMAFSFFTILGKRLCSEDDVNPMAATTPDVETTHRLHDTTKSTQRHTAQPDDLACNNINAYENEHLINTCLSEVITQSPYLAKRNITTRSIGDIAICLRNEQNTFQLDYLINAISHQMENVYAARDSLKNEKQPHHDPITKNRQNSINRMMDECIVSSLHRINNANFDLSAQTWKNAEMWHYAKVDSFRFTHVAANLSNLRNGEELKNLTELVALYSYLLSYKLEQILFVPKPEEDNDDGGEPNISQEIHDNKTQPSQCDRTKRRLFGSNESLSSDITMDDDTAFGDEDRQQLADGRRGLKRKHRFPHSYDIKEDGEPLHKRKLLDNTISRLHSGEEMPMIVSENYHDEDMPSIERAMKNSQAHSIKTIDTAVPSGKKKTLDNTANTYLRKPKYRSRKSTNYSKIYRSKQKDALRMFYRNEAITNLNDILQGIRFEKRQKANNVASYEKTLRRLNEHLNKLRKKKNNN